MRHVALCAVCLALATFAFVVPRGHPAANPRASPRVVRAAGFGDAASGARKRKRVDLKQLQEDWVLSDSRI